MILSIESCDRKSTTTSSGSVITGYAIVGLPAKETAETSNNQTVRITFFLITSIISAKVHFFFRIFAVKFLANENIV